ncbi:MAG: acetyl-CoA carboxylase biotin carboxylase subunit [Gammaproteobacteria bacterium]
MNRLGDPTKLEAELKDMDQASVIRRVLIANRGEIARRILRTLKRLNIESVVVYHAIDKSAPFIAEADIACEISGDTPTGAYLDIEQIVEIALANKVDAIHPGYGFLAENGDFADALTRAGLCFIGPSAATIRLLGDKVASREFVEEHGFPLAPSVPDQADETTLLAAAEGIGFPVLIKAAAGGGGKGMHIVHEAKEFPGAFALASSEAQRFFGDERVYCEKYVAQPRHIEVQVLADSAGNCVHLGERECSVQRRFQKVIEETPAPNLSAVTREKICTTAVDIAKAANYLNAGTVEFIMDADENFYFLEMNTRLQVEHPVTEMTTGIDLVEQQIRVAEGHSLPFTQADIEFSGHAIELRICAEDPDNDFFPVTGRVAYLAEARGEGIRVDSALAAGSEISAAFDPMLLKLIAHGESRNSARERLIKALEEQVILGLTTNSAFLRRLLAHPQFISGNTHTHFIPDHAESLQPPSIDAAELTAILAAAALSDPKFTVMLQRTPALHGAIGHWRNK